MAPRLIALLILLAPLAGVSAGASPLFCDGCVVWSSAVPVLGVPPNTDSDAVLAVATDGALVFATGDIGRDGAVVASDPETGAIRWIAHHEAGSGLDRRGEALALAGGRVFAQAMGWSDGGRLSAIDARTGLVAWTRGTGHVLPALVVSPDEALVIGPFQPTPFVDALGGFRASDGAILWSQPMQPTALALDAESLVVAAVDGASVAAVDLSGVLLWSEPMPGAEETAAGHGRVFAASALGVRAIDARSGAALWSVEGSFGAAVLSADGRTLYVGAGDTKSPGGDLRLVDAFDAATGARLWTATVPASGSPKAGYADDLALSPDGRRVYVAAHAPEGGAREYRVAAVDAATGAVAWSHASAPLGESAEPLALAVSAAGHRVFVGGGGEGGAAGLAAYATDAASVRIG